MTLEFFDDLAFLFTSDNRNRGIIRLNFDEAACLWKAVKATRGPVREIGRRHGGSTVLLVAAAGPGRHVESIDIAPAHHSTCERVFAKYVEGGRLTLHVADSRTFSGAPVGCLFIDGDHSYEGVLGDVKAHWPQVQTGGPAPALVAFHDAVPNLGLAHEGQDNHCEGVARVCAELLTAGVAVEWSTAGSMLVLQKLGELPPSFSIEPARAATSGLA